MADIVRLKKAIILGGLYTPRDKYIRRSKLAGTRFDDPEFIMEPDDRHFNDPPWSAVTEVKTEVVEEVSGGPGPGEDEVVNIPGVEREIPPHKIRRSIPPRRQ
jgi:hypothetical protein